MTEVLAKIHYLRMAPRKVRLVADVIRGMNATEAHGQLVRLSKRASLPLRKLLNSAIANAKHNFKLEEGNLYIAEIRVDGGPVLKRMFPRSRGRADVKKKRMSHVTLILKEKSEIRNPKSETNSNEQHSKSKQSKI